MLVRTESLTRLSWLWLFLSLHWWTVLVSTEPISIIVGGGAVAAMSMFYGTYQYTKCHFYECCNDNWIKMNMTGLQRTMRSRLYGQHLAQQTAVPAIEAHLKNENPKKALVISFHGWTGCGKNYLTSMVADNMYRTGMKSEYVHMFISTLHFSDPDEISVYQRNLREWIHGNVSLCERSLFIFDEVDKMPPKVMDAIKPFIDHYEHLDNTDYRKSVFIFLSNSGGNEITGKTLQHYQSGHIRETITLSEMEDVLMTGAFNADGGLKMSDLISTHLIDHFIPFLPLERRHVVLCIRDYMKTHNFSATEEQVAQIADSLQYFPKSNPIYSSSGCKRVAQKTELLISMERDKENQRLRRLSLNSEDDDLV